RHHALSVVPYPTSCLNVSRKGTRSDFRNRMLRPITRRWGVCFRSTQRYTVWGLTPRKRAAALTVIGRFASGELSVVGSIVLVSISRLAVARQAIPCYQRRLRTASVYCWSEFPDLKRRTS